MAQGAVATWRSRRLSYPSLNLVKGSGERVGSGLVTTGSESHVDESGKCRRDEPASFLIGRAIPVCCATFGLRRSSSAFWLIKPSSMRQR